MHGFAPSLTPFRNFLAVKPLLFSEAQSKFLVPDCSKFIVIKQPGFSHTLSCRNYYCYGERRNKRCASVRASRRESPYEVLGVSPSATPNDIKRAYRRLALKYHPDVNKEANAQERFMRIKHAYNTLLNKSDRRFDKGNRGSESSYSTAGRNDNWTVNNDEEFYGFGNFLRDVQISIEDFFKDLQEEFRNWEAGADSQGKPKSLWEELAEIGEEFVEFLEKELNISDVEAEQTKGNQQQWGNASYGSKETGNVNQNGADNSGIEENINDIEAALAQLKKELGL
ncbi:uncharacterized protein [Coffea arabica]|uniref:Uncharacterized protein isoform X1 n=1 Tax=Coffea arabica TaxID=13443 RepID=A0A6P6W5H6_COFAR